MAASEFCKSMSALIKSILRLLIVIFLIIIIIIILLRSKARILHEYNNYHLKPNKRKILGNCTAVVKN